MPENDWVDSPIDNEWVDAPLPQTQTDTPPDEELVDTLIIEPKKEEWVDAPLEAQQPTQQDEWVDTPITEPVVAKEDEWVDTPLTETLPPRPEGFGEYPTVPQEPKPSIAGEYPRREITGDFAEFNQVISDMGKMIVAGMPVDKKEQERVKGLRYAELIREGLDAPPFGEGTSFSRVAEDLAIETFGGLAELLTTPKGLLQLGAFRVALGEIIKGGIAYIGKNYPRLFEELIRKRTLADPKGRLAQQLVRVKDDPVASRIFDERLKTQAQRTLKLHEEKLANAQALRAKVKTAKGFEEEVAKRGVKGMPVEKPVPAPKRFVETPSERIALRRGQEVAEDIASIKGGEVYSPRPKLYRAAIDFLKPTETRIGQEGIAGKELQKRIIRAQDVGEVRAGKRIVQLKDSGALELSEGERVNLMDVMEGRAEPIDDRVASAFESIRDITDDIASEATGAKVKVRVKTTLIPGQKIPPGARLTRGQQEKFAKGHKIPIVYRRAFRGRENFFPHIIPNSASLRKGKIRSDVIANLVRQEIRPNVESATKFLDEFRKFIDEGGRADSVEKYLVESGQVANQAEAFRLLNIFRKRSIRRQGSLEYSRQVDLPFYDPDPARVLPPFIHSTSLRLAQIREFGQSNEKINKLINKIDKSGGNAIFVRGAVDRILGLVKEPDTGTAQLSRALRIVQGFKLGLASIPNSTQGAINVLLKTKNLRDTIAGIKGVFTEKGRRLGMESGASIEGVIDELTRYAGAERSRVLSTFLKAVGFTPTERANRVFAANASVTYTNRLLNKLKAKPTNAGIRLRLEEVGLNPDAILEQGKITGDDVLIAAKKLSDITQFRAGPKDLPFFASTNEGKVFFQFKNYIYGQTRLIYRELIQELIEKRPGEAFKALLILAIAFPLVGEVVADIRSFLTGRNRSAGLARYFENIASVGAMGVFSDILASGKYGRTTGFIAGPTIGEAGEVIDVAVRAGETGKFKSLMRQAFKKIPVFGPTLINRVFPYKKKKIDPLARPTR